MSNLQMYKKMTMICLGLYNLSGHINSVLNVLKKTTHTLKNSYLNSRNEKHISYNFHQALLKIGKSLINYG